MSTSIRCRWCTATSALTGKPLGLGAAHQFEPGRRGQPAQVHAAAGVAHQVEDRVQRDGFGSDRDAGKPQSRRHRSAVRDAVARQVRILRAQPDREAVGVRIQHRAQQHLRVEDRRAGLREADATGLGQFGHLGDRLAVQSDGQRAERIQARLVEPARAVLEHLDQARLVERRVGVRRARQRGDAAGERRAASRIRASPGTRSRARASARHRSTSPGATTSRARRARARRGSPPARRRSRRCARRRRAGRRRRSSPEAGSTTRPLRMDSLMRSRLREDAHHGHAHRDAEGDLSRITACGPSATADSISTPRFIGPGMHDDRSRARPARASPASGRSCLKYSCAVGSSAPRMRSFCSRSMMITSTSRMPSRMS